MTDLVRESVINLMMAEVLDCNRANGWFEKDRRFGEDIALLHSEVSEALEEYRVHGTKAYITRRGMGEIQYLDNRGGGYGTYKPEGVPSELADILIRLLDTAYRCGVNLAAEFDAKMAYNRTRGHRHGGKAL